MNEEYENVDDEDNLLEEEDSRNSKSKKNIHIYIFIPCISIYILIN